MSSLSSALDTAKSSLAASQTQTSVISRNIANVNTVGATRKYANVVTGVNGQVQVKSIAQSSNSVLYRNMLDANAAVGRGNVISNGLDRINDLLGDTQLSRSPASMVTKLGDALSTLAASPNNYELARSAATAAGDVVATLNEASETVQTIRRDADNELVLAAADMTKILANIEDLNNRIIAGTRVSADITDLSDQRDQAVVALSQYVGVTSQMRGDNDLVLYTDSGVTLFEAKARSVQYSPTPGLNASVTQGNAFRIDGTPVTGDTAYMPLKSGSVAGLVALRDDVMLTYQTQLDEIARGLVDATKESAAGLPDVHGLFTSTDPSALATVSTLPLGTFSAGSMAAGDTLSFTFRYANRTYAVSGTLATADFASGNAFAAKLDAMIEAAVPPSGGPALGAGKIAVAAGAANALTVSASGVGSFVPMAISDIVALAGGAGANDPARDGGLTPGATDPAEKLVVGLAGSLRLAAGVVADPTRLRDGVVYTYNPAGNGGYTGRLNQLSDALNASRSFSETSGAASNVTVADYAASSVSWLQDYRKTSSSETEYKTTLLESTRKTLSDETGINMDEQLTHLTEIQRSYQASAKLITTIDEMLKTLIDSI